MIDRMWNLLLVLLCTVIYSAYGDGYVLKTESASPKESALEREIKNGGLFNADRRSIYAKRPPQEPERRSILDQAGYAQSYLNQALEAKIPEPTPLLRILKPFPKTEEQSQYLHPNSEAFRRLRQSILRRANERVEKLAETNEEKARDASMKMKIALIVDQTLRDANQRLKTIESLKDDYKDKAAFKIGFILVMIKKSRDVMNELFNVAVKHRDQWQALEQLKIFELIVHTNADTTTLVQQMQDIHTSSGGMLPQKPNVVNALRAI